MAFFSIIDDRQKNCVEIQRNTLGVLKKPIKTVGNSFEEKHFSRFLRILNRTDGLTRAAAAEERLPLPAEWCSARKLLILTPLSTSRTG